MNTFTQFTCNWAKDTCVQRSLMSSQMITAAFVKFDMWTISTRSTSFSTRDKTFNTTSFFNRTPRSSYCFTDATITSPMFEITSWTTKNFLIVKISRAPLLSAFQTSFCLNHFSFLLSGLIRWWPLLQQLLQDGNTFCSWKRASFHDVRYIAFFQHSVHIKLCILFRVVNVYTID